ncbi:hypothetical protein EMIHUDRAFT_235876 [Emiliania huxleyi CCMP1516]|uniref:EF-hand domain-containing protein n=3 Tax=Emiliania huxleyi TaxID=2903 RepID=A0A0D3JV65_EMIH1|nr:hypothetical protein EMIHUDRAFT_235876 [Emiliania huxleyi CCMP1516]EOD27400.1 hypothetical protein EMIHUDRAFT_235876 [Emiliania huxleyi CCMP1516]|eukprot:XP_005779829.1 hypothetical protein EMIHUDRAFT_235876 [Emiliania huxleyi CCMP1516]
MADLAARLTGLAKTANAQGAIDSAASLFDAAHAIGGRVQARISAANMRLKLQQPEQACSEFDALLSQSPPLDPIAHAMVLRKRGDALAMMESGPASEVVSAPLRIDPSVAATTAGELTRLGSSSNAGGQHSLAAYAYTAAFALTRKRELRISAANMTLKTGGVANAQIAANEYDAICTEAASSGDHDEQASLFTSMLRAVAEAVTTGLRRGDGCSAAPMEPRRPPHRPAPIFGADPGTARDGDLPAVAASKDQPPSSSSIIPGREEAATSAYVNPPGARVGGQPSKWKGVLTKAVALAKLTKQRELASQLPLPVPTGGLTGLGAAAALCEAAASADLERLRTMVLIQGRTAIHIAASEGYLQVVRLLVEELGSEHSPQDRWGGTPMNDAERHQHLDVVRYLESIGARGHEMRGDPDGPATELCRAAARADLERLRELVRNKGYDINAADYDKRTAMHLAASEGKLKVVRLLVGELKADHSPRDRWGGTPMNDATRHQHLDVVDYLRSAGAQLGSAVARDEGHRPVGSSPIRSDNGPAAELCDAAARADLERLRELVRNKGYDVNAADYDKRTAMHLAASEGKLKVVRLLVGELKADHSPRDRWGGTPMNDATRHQHLDVVDYLRSAGAQLGSAAQDAGSESTGRNKRGPWRPAHAAHEVAAAQQHLEMTIQQVHSSFAKFDADGSGLLEPAEVAAALNSLGALSGGREADASEAQRIMISHDYKNDALTADQFKDLVRVLAMEGQIELKGELQAEVDKITKAEKEDPWAVALRGDKVVRGMVDKLRLKMAGCEDMDASLAGSIASFSTDKRGRRGCLGCFTVAISCCGVIPILHPNRWFCSSWTMLMALLVVYCAVTVPLEVAFEGTSLKIALGSGGWQTWEICNVLGTPPEPPKRLR